MIVRSARGAAYLAYSRLRGDALASEYARLVERDRAMAIDSLSMHRLEAMLRHASTAVPYYRALFRERAIGLADNPLASLARLPILTKDILRNRKDDLCSVDLGSRRWRHNTSGGSTGEPVLFVQDAEYTSSAAAITMLFSRWAGRELGEPEVRLWGSERDIFEAGSSPKARVFRWLTNTTYLNAFRMSPDSMREFVRVLDRVRPKLIVAYAQSIYDFARFLESEGLRVARVGAIVTSAGTLYPFMRETIERAFGCRVHNRYGSREVGDIACQCSCVDGLHVGPGAFVEIVDGQGLPVPPGTPGDIVVTSLINHAMPLLRYAIGDRGVLSDRPCACGRPGPILAEVLGRNVDSFHTRDGTLIDGEYFTHLLYFRPWVNRFQVIQRAFDRVEFLVVRLPGQQPQQEELDEIERKSRLVLGSDCVVEVRFVDAIASSASGKFRYTISEVAT